MIFMFYAEVRVASDETEQRSEVTVKFDFSRWFCDEAWHCSCVDWPSAAMCLDCAVKRVHELITLQEAAGLTRQNGRVRPSQVVEIRRGHVGSLSKLRFRAPNLDNEKEHVTFE